MKYKILQPKRPSFMVDSDKVDYISDEFEIKYESEFPSEGMKDFDVLEKLFYMFNMKRPHDFHGHSLSVGDIVVLDKQAYICDSFGWNKINLT